MTAPWSWKSAGSIDRETLSAFFEFWRLSRKNGFGSMERTMMIDVGPGAAYRGDADQITANVEWMRANMPTRNNFVLVEIKRLYQEPYIKADRWLIAQIGKLLGDHQLHGHVIYWAWENYMSGFWCEHSLDAMMLKFGLKDYDPAFNDEAGSD